MSFHKINRWKIHNIKGINYLVIMFFVVAITAGCATQHKYKKFKPVPCPCEKENKK